MKIGTKLVNQEFITTTGQLTCFDNYRGKWLVIYFYPKDSTPGCTIEGQNFSSQYAEFTNNNAVIFGVSRDSLKSHEKFKSCQNFPFELISDTDEKLCTQFDVLKMKSLFGKQYKGLERSTFLINPEGVVTDIWRNVKIKGHVNEVLEVLKSKTHSPLNGV